jgi:hypothetical protein
MATSENATPVANPGDAAAETKPDPWDHEDQNAADVSDGEALISVCQHITILLGHSLMRCDF